MFTRARVPEHPNGARRAAMLDLVEPQATVMQRHLHRSGFAGFQRPTTRALLASWELSGPAPVFYDVGANSALYGALCKVMFPAATVVAFEPFPETASAARRMLARNRLDVTVEERAVSDRSGRATLHLSRVSDGSHSLVEGFKPAYGRVDVGSVTLDAYLATSGPPPDVVKIDVELHESDVLRGAGEVLQRHRPVIVAEVIGGNHLEQGSAVQRVLEPHGYRAFPLAEPPEWTPREHVSAMGRGRGRDWLFFPGELPRRFPERVDAWDRSLQRCRPTLSQRLALRMRRTKRVLERYVMAARVKA